MVKETLTDIAKSIQLTVLNTATAGASSFATYEAIYSNLPGRTNGPADAYRHVLLAAALTIQFGSETAFILLGGQELIGYVTGSNSPEERAMDLHNNGLGIKLGESLRVGTHDPDWVDVLYDARHLFESSDGSGLSDTLVWLPEGEWKDNPKVKIIDPETNKGKWLELETTETTDAFP